MYQDESKLTNNSLFIVLYPVPKHLSQAWGAAFFLWSRMRQKLLHRRKITLIFQLLQKNITARLCMWWMEGYYKQLLGYMDIIFFFPPSDIYEIYRVQECTTFWSERGPSVFEKALCSAQSPSKDKGKFQDKGETKRRNMIEASSKIKVLVERLRAKKK